MVVSSTRFLSGLLAVTLCGATTLGCSGGGSSGGPAPTASPAPVTEAATRELMDSSTTICTFGAFPLQLALDEVSPGNYSTGIDSGGSLNILVVGDSSSGTVTIDFSGTGGGGASLSGSISANYAGTSTSGTVNVFFNALRFTNGTDDLSIDGSLIITYSASGSSATGTITGSVTVNRNGVTTTVTVNHVIDLDGTTGRAVYSGTSTIVHSLYGTWTITYTGVTYEDDGTGDHAISAGTVVITRTLPTPAVATYVFTGPSMGTFDISPLGATGTFFL